MLVQTLFLASASVIAATSDDDHTQLLSVDRSVNKHQKNGPTPEPEPDTGGACPSSCFGGSCCDAFDNCQTKMYVYAGGYSCKAVQLTTSSTALVDCGSVGTTQEQCIESMGSSGAACTWEIPNGATCDGATASSEDCGFVGITQDSCENKGCCWDATAASPLPWCYQRTVADSSIPWCYE